MWRSYPLIAPDGPRQRSRDRPTTVQASRAHGRSRRPSGTRVSAIAFANSARRISSTPATPASPSAARPQIVGRATSTALAPSAKRRQHVGAAPNATVHQHRDAARDLRRPPRAGRRGPPATRSSWRPPWFETTIASAPACTASSASSAVRRPFTITGSPGARSLIQPRSSHVIDGVEHVVARADADRHHEPAARVAVAQPVDDEVDGPADRARIRPTTTRRSIAAVNPRSSAT